MQRPSPSLPLCEWANTNALLSGLSWLLVSHVHCRMRFSAATDLRRVGGQGIKPEWPSRVQVTNFWCGRAARWASGFAPTIPEAGPLAGFQNSMVDSTNYLAELLNWMHSRGLTKARLLFPWPLRRKLSCPRAVLFTWIPAQEKAAVKNLVQCLLKGRVGRPLSVPSASGNPRTHPKTAL